MLPSESGLILKLERNFPCYNAVHAMGADEGDEIVLVNPSEIMPIMAAVPEGRLTTLSRICLRIARNHGVKGCCSLTTGIFIMTIANAVEEMKREGTSSAVPWWRTRKSDGSLNEKYPGGAAAQKDLLEKEGLTVLRKGKRFVVKDFGDFLVAD